MANNQHQSNPYSPDLSTIEHRPRILLSKEKIKDYGGYGYFEQNAKREPFFAVGNLDVAMGYCTATWLGEDTQDNYLLTAAHCVVDEDLKSVPTTMKITFTTWNDKKITDSQAQIFVAPRYLQLLKDGNTRNEDLTANDVAIIKLSKARDSTQILDNNGQKIIAPIVYDLKNNLEAKYINLVGYGARYINKILDKEFAYPKKALWAKNRISKDAFNDGYLNTEYRDGVNWAATTIGDSGGGAWLQNNSLVGIVSRAYPSFTKQFYSRVSFHSEWIKGIFPQVKLWSQLSEFDKLPRIKPNFIYQIAIANNLSITLTNKQLRLQKTNNNSLQQSWIIRWNHENQAVQIHQLSDSGMVMSLENNQLILTNNLYLPQQFWHIREKQGGKYYISNKKYPNLVLDLDREDLNEGGKLRVAPLNNPNHQLFTLTKNPVAEKIFDDVYTKIKSSVLDVSAIWLKPRGIKNTTEEIITNFILYSIDYSQDIEALYRKTRAFSNKIIGWLRPVEEKNDFGYTRFYNVIPGVEYTVKAKFKQPVKEGTLLLNIFNDAIIDEDLIKIVDDQSEQYYIEKQVYQGAANKQEVEFKFISQLDRVVIASEQNDNTQSIVVAPSAYFQDTFDELVWINRSKSKTSENKAIMKDDIKINENNSVIMLSRDYVNSNSARHLDIEANKDLSLVDFSSTATDVGVAKRFEDQSQNTKFYIDLKGKVGNTIITLTNQYGLEVTKFELRVTPDEIKPFGMTAKQIKNMTGAVMTPKLNSNQNFLNSFYFFFNDGNYLRQLYDGSIQQPLEIAKYWYISNSQANQINAALLHPVKSDLLYLFLKNGNYIQYHLNNSTNSELDGEWGWHGVNSDQIKNMVAAINIKSMQDKTYLFLNDGSYILYDLSGKDRAEKLVGPYSTYWQFAGITPLMARNIKSAVVASVQASDLLNLKLGNEVIIFFMKDGSLVYYSTEANNQWQRQLYFD